MRSESEHARRFRVRVTNIRKVREMTQAQLADATGLARPTVGKIEKGIQGVDLDQAVAICSALDVPIGDMLSAEPMTLVVRVPID